MILCNITIRHIVDEKEYSNLVTLSKKIIDTYFRVINSKRFFSIDICI